MPSSTSACVQIQVLITHSTYLNADIDIDYTYFNWLSFQKLLATGTVALLRWTTSLSPLFLTAS